MLQSHANWKKSSCQSRTVKEVVHTSYYSRQPYNAHLFSFHLTAPPPRLHCWYASMSIHLVPILFLKPHIIHPSSFGLIHISVDWPHSLSCWWYHNASTFVPPAGQSALASLLFGCRITLHAEWARVWAAEGGLCICLVWQTVSFHPFCADFLTLP